MECMDYLSLHPDRYRASLDLFCTASKTKDGRPTTADLCNAAGISRRTLLNRQSAETQARVISAQARLLRLDEGRWTAWLLGDEEPEIQAFVDIHSIAVQCTHCMEWFDREDEEGFILKLRSCRSCQRKRQFKRRLELHPEKAAFLEQVKAEIPQAKKKDPELASIVLTILAACRAIKMSEIAQKLHTTPKVALVRWKDAGLPWVAAATLAAAEGVRQMFL